MRKYIIGTLFGLLIGTSISVYAEVVSMVGKVVEGELLVNINGKTLNNKAIVVDGTSYLPVHAIGDTLGYNASYVPNEGIKLYPKFDEKGLKIKYLPIVNINNTYTINSDDYYYLESDGNQYVSVNSLVGPYDFYWPKPGTAVFHPLLETEKSKLDTNGIFNKKADDVIIKVSDEYVKDAEAFRYEGMRGRVFVKLSSLNLKAEVKYNDQYKVDELVITIRE
ncbi:MULTISPECIES: hypothetical protein [Brevibacillus]|uniref:Copper amine oxidase-like N-terminal domain-containing protein n=1 Tax=Brevibacillus porteri TaxID=2126350 RepID=A0ABX5FX49_9BACL|nr:MULTISPECIES: hypothetical protein [Brevibacillus]MDC0762894.1 hypothetical protein [Brevibacillus sp. AG]MED1797724.1 hypothetical protein [Brevibacillus porteri]MED2130535.1 hypothetical protein [Brevibacillus porteri]MED2745284.1 hypothetical protein [Brevibacillus porteri]MED2812774.1 hypothetical protein [Brevibacillus porteri]